MSGSGLSRMAVLSFVVVLSGGCWFHGPGEIRREISRTTGTEYSTELGLTLGRTSMAIARFGLDIADEEPEFSLEGVRKIQIGIYHPLEDAEQGPARGPLGAESFQEWDPLVRMLANGETVLVLVREKDARIRDMLVIVDDQSELVVVRLKGKLDRILRQAMELGFDQADRPDLIGPALEQAERDLDPVGS